MPNVIVFAERGTGAKRVMSTDVRPLEPPGMATERVVALSPLLIDAALRSVAEVENVESSGKDSVSAFRHNPGLSSGVDSTGVLIQAMRRRLAAGTASDVMSTATESVETDYARPEKAATAAFLEDWAEPGTTPGPSKPASVSTAELEVLPLAVTAGVPAKGRSSRRLS